MASPFSCSIRSRSWESSGESSWAMMTSRASSAVATCSRCQSMTDSPRSMSATDSRSDRVKSSSRLRRPTPSIIVPQDSRKVNAVATLAGHVPAFGCGSGALRAQRAVRARRLGRARRSAERERSEENAQRHDQHDGMAKQNARAKEGKGGQRGEVKRAPLHDRLRVVVPGGTAAGTPTCKLGSHTPRPRAKLLSVPSWGSKRKLQHLPFQVGLCRCRKHFRKTISRK